MQIDNVIRWTSLCVNHFPQARRPKLERLSFFFEIIVQIIDAFDAWPRVREHGLSRLLRDLQARELAPYSSTNVVVYEML